MTEKTVHEGRNVKRIREMLGIKQDVLAHELGISQPAISALEQKEALDKDMLEKIAKVLRVTPEAIKHFSEEATINYIGNTNTFTGNDVAAGFNFYPVFNPIEKWMEALAANKDLYERLLQAEKEKVALLEAMLKEKK